MFMKFAAIAAVTALVATPALAADAAIAQLNTVKGSVMVNAKSATASALKAGDRVVASKGSASVKFADGCTVSLKAGSMLTVGAKSPCAAGAGVVSATSAQPAQEFLGLAGPELYLAGAVVIAAAAGFAATSDDNATSP